MSAVLCKSYRSNMYLLLTLSRSAGKDLYDAFKCIFGSCPAPPQVTVNMLEGKTTQEFKMSSQLTQGGLVYGNSKATVLCANCYIKVSSLKVEGTVRVLPK